MAAALADPPAPEILYRSDNLEVRRVRGGDSRRQVVTFEPFHDDRGFARGGFGQGFFQREGLDAIHILSADNDWFNHPEMDEALAAIRAALAGADRVLAYGSSMGGYAAIRFADAIGATHVLALSPQFTIDRRRLPAERRWWREQTRITFRDDYNGRIACAADVVVAYDPALRMDAVHARLIARDVPIRTIRLPHAGHPVAPFLNELGLLQPLAAGYAVGPVDTGRIEAAAAAGREQSAVWLIERSARLPVFRRHAALAFAEKALAISPTNATVLHQYGMRLHAQRRFAAAADAHRRAVAGLAHPGFRLALSKALFFGGGREEALRVAEEVVAAARDEHTYVRWLGRIRADLGDHEGAARDYARVLRLRPSARALFGAVRRRLRLEVERARARFAGSPGSGRTKP